MVTTFSYCNFDTHKAILIIFGRNVVEKIGNQMVPYFTTSPNCASAPPGKTTKCKNFIFFHMLYYCIASLQPVASLLYSVLFLATHANAAV